MATNQVMTEQDFERFQEWRKQKEFQQFLNETVFKHDPVNQAQTAGNLHGLNPAGTLGLFGAPGVDPRMFQTIVRAGGSWSRALTLRPSVMLNPRFEILTGITQPSGTNPTDFCGDPAAPGDLKVCQQDFEFAEVAMKTDTVMGPKVGAYYTNADIDRELLVDGPGFGPFVPDPVMAATDRNSITWKVLYELGLEADLYHEQALIEGLRTAPANGAGSIKYFIKQGDGIDRLIRTGYTDKVSGVACPAVDSRVISFNAELTGTDANGDTIVDVVQDAYTGMDMDLVDMGYTQHAGYFLMHPRMWRPITRQWPCAYATTGCNIVSANGERLNITADTQRAMQDDMYRGKYLMVDGMRIPVLFSRKVPIVNIGPDLWNGTLYYITERLNSELGLFVEYFNMGNPQQQEWYSQTGADALSRVTNGGLYRMGKRAKADCIEYEFKSMWRLILRAPFGAIRWDGIRFADRTRTRSPYTGESYYKDGGLTSRINNY